MSSEPSIRKGSERLKLEFGVTGQPTAQASDGLFVVTKAIFTDYGDKANLKVTGTRASGWSAPRSQTFNVHGYPDKPNPPEWLDRLFTEALNKYMRSTP